MKNKKCEINDLNNNDLYEKALYDILLKVIFIFLVQDFHMKSTTSKIFLASLLSCVLQASAGPEKIILHPGEITKYFKTGACSVPFQSVGGKAFLRVLVSNKESVRLVEKKLIYLVYDPKTRAYFFYQEGIGRVRDISDN